MLAGEDADLREAALAVAQQLAADDGSLRRMQQVRGLGVGLLVVATQGPLGGLAILSSFHFTAQRPPHHS